MYVFFVNQSHCLVSSPCNHLSSTWYLAFFWLSVWDDQKHSQNVWMQQQGWSLVIFSQDGVMISTSKW